MKLRDNVVACPSPNFRAVDPGRKVTCVVIHATATAALASPKAWLCNPESKVSAHYLIDVDGAALALVDENDVAWHAGESWWKGLPNVNNFSVGIELVNPNDGQTPYPEPQLAACAALVRAICADHGIGPEDVTGHVNIVAGKTPEEKAERLKLHSDPRGFPWDDFRARLA